MDNPCIVIATFTPKPEHYDEVKSLLLEVLPDVHQEEGCELYALHEEVEGRLVMVEKWSSRELWQRHGELEPVARIKAGIEGRLARELDVQEMYGVAVSSYPEAL